MDTECWQCVRSGPHRKKWEGETVEEGDEGRREGEGDPPRGAKF
jgi:hypothetical protein